MTLDKLIEKENPLSEFIKEVVYTIIVNSLLAACFAIPISINLLCNAPRKDHSTCIVQYDSYYFKKNGVELAVPYSSLILLSKDKKRYFIPSYAYITKGENKITDQKELDDRNSLCRALNGYSGDVEHFFKDRTRRYLNKQIRKGTGIKLRDNFFKGKTYDSSFKFPHKIVIKDKNLTYFVDYTFGR